MWCGAALLTVTAIGCQKPSNGVPIHGHVAYQGQPIESCALIFYPEHGRAAVASTDAAGEYHTNLPAGEYAVTVNISVKPPAGWKEGDPLPTPKIVLPDKYTSRVKTSVKAEVKAGQTDAVNFDLK
ncbi:MAG TPA: carboxypeptidase-like regulatory domain-containing protein [Lacipirellulaceae bacterium]|jgi:hypothetical protein|nr:carboxypeptidase-like regulatory domain-containing protein [Lacipirellulaceae bacterium]